jgi:hypothetical protein
MSCDRETWERVLHRFYPARSRHGRDPLFRQAGIDLDERQGTASGWNGASGTLGILRDAMWSARAASLTPPSTHEEANSLQSTLK